ncbi:MAG: tRNA lysidine(34) synthetase TilS [Acidobacteria bacterium]|nr:tRNA lysidine(34) synthetase TilS [Acidobacteriota bacterium]
MEGVRFARRLWSEWKRLGLPLAEQRVVVAVSGGADSTALLLALDELKRAGRISLKVTVAHLDHGLRGEAGESDARWVHELARGLDYEVVLGEADVRGRASGERDNLEQAARRARYEFLAETAARVEAYAVLTAHTMDDQAETLLLRLMRGSGLDGLGGMEPVRALSEETEVLLARPLLGWARRAWTEKYCRERGADFRTDALNEDESFARVRVRKKLLPLMQTFNGRAVEALARTAELLRADASALRAAAQELLLAATDEAETSGAACLRVNVLAGADTAVRRRALRLWLASARGDLRRLELAHLLAVERLVSGTRGGRVAELPGAGSVLRKRGRLFFHTEKVEKEE